MVRTVRARVSLRPGGPHQPLDGRFRHRDALPLQVSPYLPVTVQGLRRSAVLRVWLIDPGQDLGDRRVPPRPSGRSRGQVCPARSRYDLDIVHSQRTADRYDPSLFPVGVDDAQISHLRSQTTHYWPSTTIRLTYILISYDDLQHPAESARQLREDEAERVACWAEDEEDGDEDRPSAGIPR